MVHSVYPEGKWTLYTTGMDKEAYAEDISSLGVEGDNIWAGTH